MKAFSFLTAILAVNPSLGYQLQYRNVSIPQTGAGPTLVPSGTYRDSPTRRPSVQPASRTGNGGAGVIPATTLPLSTTGPVPASSPASSSAVPIPVTVTNGETAAVMPGVVVVGGVGGGFFSILGGSGGAVAVPAGSSTVASETSGEDDDDVDEVDDSSPSSSISSSWSSASPSATAAAASSKSYMIFPADGADTTSFYTWLQQLIVPKQATAVDIIDPNTNSNITVMWVADLTDSQVGQVKDSSAVAGLEANLDVLPVAPVEAEAGDSVIADETTAKRSSSMNKRQVVNTQTDDSELIQLSTPEGNSPANTFDYDESAGAGISVYVIDNTFLLEHQEFTDGERTIRKLDVPDMNGEEASSDGDLHGTCTASKAVGNTAGSAPKANLVAVDLANKKVATVIAAFTMIAQDIARNNLKGKAVISCSVLASSANIADLGIAKMKQVMEILVKFDVPVVVSAGNFGEDTPEIDSYPGLLASDSIPIINVGAVNDKGENPVWSQGGDKLTTAAGGVDIVCATNEGDDAYRMKQGTSYAAPLVAGMVAYWLGNPKYAEAFPAGSVALAARDSVTALHWPRLKGGYNVAFNGVGMDDCDEEAGSAQAKAKRSLVRRQSGSNSTVGLGSYFASLACAASNSHTNSTTPSTTQSSFTTVITAAPTASPVPDPVYCYNFDVKCYGFCCPGDNVCDINKSLGYCSCGDGTGSANNIPSNAACPMDSVPERQETLFGYNMPQATGT